MFNRPPFENQYLVYSDIYIDGDGIHDGHVVHRWRDVATCSIDESNQEELKSYFGDDYDERPYAINMTHIDGSSHSITLFGQGWDKAVETSKAINYFSGRDMVSSEKLQGKPIPLLFIIGIVFLASVLMASLLL